MDLSGEWSHGDRVPPLRIGLWDPFLTWPFQGLINGGDPNCLQVLG